MTSNDWIKELNLEPHPEGGHFRETYRSSESLAAECLPAGFAGDRACCTAIYYLLEQGQFSAFHRIRSDELWHFYDGDPLEVVILSEGRQTADWLRIGRGPGLHLQAVVPAGAWFAARCRPGSEFSLCGCTVAPGFDFADFEMAKRDFLCRLFPNHNELIHAFTRSS